jgi:hypothetical protein
VNPFRAWISDKPSFIIWRGSDKSPIDPLHSAPQSDFACSDAQNPATWLPWDIAAEYARVLGPGYGVGIVIQPGILCVDIDGCIDADGQLTPIARTLIADAVRLCPDAYVELSMSGKGVHIIGPYTGAAPLHSTKNHEHHLELYTAKRYIALTGNTIIPRGAAGGSLTDFLLSTAWTYFKPSALSDTPALWTTENDPACTFTGSTDERIEALRKMKSLAARFSPSKITFEDLHSVNVVKLGAIWPPNPNGKSGLPYDGSSVDQAYFNHLAYGLANNCEAIEQYALSAECPLHREKWDARPDYLRSTILKAVAIPKKWKRRGNAPVVPPAFAAPRPPTLTAPPPPSAATNTGIPKPPDTMPAEPETLYVGASNIVETFAGCVWIQDVNVIVGPDGFEMDRAQFDADERFAKRLYQMKIDGTEPGKSGWDAFLQSAVSQGVKVRGKFFDPREEPGAIIVRDDVRMVNTWRPVTVVMEPGDVTPWLTHLSTLFVDWRLLNNYCKFMMQRKGEKVMWWPFLQGVPGNGKSFINNTMEYCMSPTFTQRPKASKLDSNFNASLYGCLFLGIDDIKVAEDYASMWETLKPMVTDPRLEIEPKGVDKVTREVCFNAIMNSNHKDGIRKTVDDRRIAPMFAKQQRKPDLLRDGLTEEYFKKLRAWAIPELGGQGWAHIAYYLANDPIDADFDPGSCPWTSSTDEAIKVGRPPGQQEVLERVQGHAPGFRGGWLNMYKVSQAMDSRRIRMTAAAQVAMVEELGYIPHPGLPDGRVLTGLSDSTLPVLYVLAGHTSVGVTDPAAVKAMYETANRA